MNTRRTRTSRLLTGLLMAASLVGCTGVVGGPPSQGASPQGSAGSPGSQASGGGSSGGSGGTSSVIQATILGPSAGRRLTKAEYLHTVQDLLGVDLSGANDSGLP